MFQIPSLYSVIPLRRPDNATPLHLAQELLPVILCLAVQHPNPTTRDNLLHLLFNLVKKPDFDQRWVPYLALSHYRAWLSLCGTSTLFVAPLPKYSCWRYFKRNAVYFDVVWPVDTSTRYVAYYRTVSINMNLKDITNLHLLYKLQISLTCWRQL